MTDKVSINLEYWAVASFSLLSSLEVLQRKKEIIEVNYTNSAPLKAQTAFLSSEEKNLMFS